MNKNREYFLGIFYRLVDIISLNIAFFIAEFLRFRDEAAYGFYENKYLNLLIFINLSWVILSQVQNIYNLFSFSSKRRYFFQVAIAVIIELVITIGFNGLIRTFYSRLFLFYTFIGFGSLMSLGRFIINGFYKIYLHKKSYKNVLLLIGKGFPIKDVQSFLDESGLNQDFQTIELIEDSTNLIEKLKQFNEKSSVSELYINLSEFRGDIVEELPAYCDNNFIRLRLVLDSNKISSKQIETRQFNQTTVLSVPLTPLDDPYNTLLKRVFDILFSLVIIITVLSWLFPILSLMVKITSKGPVFFRQKRTGIDNKEFYCWKFRSMKINDDSDKIQATKDDVRITSVGRFLRRASLDELPQFFNVLRGEMSVVGPRPHMLKHTLEYSKLTDNFMNRHAIKPGITGLAQIKGYRGEIDDSHLLLHRVRLDRFYVNNWSLYFDVKILFYTIFIIFKDHR